MKKLLKSRSGMALPLAIICIMLASVLVIGLLTYASQSTQNFINVQSYKKASYLARTGIEVVMRAYPQLDASFKKEKLTRAQPIYQLADGSYTNDLTKATPTNPPVGKVEVEVQNQVEKKLNPGTPQEKKFDAVVFTATATLLSGEVSAPVAGSTATATAYTVKTLDGYANGWYDINGKIKPAGTPNGDGMYVYDFLANMRLPYPPGNSDARLQLDYDKDGKHKLAFVGSLVWVEPPVDLRMNHRNNGEYKILMTAGRDLIFENSIEMGIRRTGLTIGSDTYNRNLGTMLLAVPAYLSYTDPKTGEQVGKVYFNGDVTISIATGLFPREERVKLFSAGEVYYFRAHPSNSVADPSKPNEIFYVDLIRYFLSPYSSDPHSSYGKIYQSIYGTEKPYKAADMRKIDPRANPGVDSYTDLAAPDPNGGGYTIWE